MVGAFWIYLENLDLLDNDRRALGDIDKRDFESQLGNTYYN
mgnify:CR=1 FL=1